MERKSQNQPKKQQTITPQSDSMREAASPSMDFLQHYGINPTPQQVMMLQRKYGNQATMKILSGQPVHHSLPATFMQRDPVPSGAAVTLDDDDEDSYSYSDSEEDERDVPMPTDGYETAPDNETLRDELVSMGKDGILSVYGSSVLSDLFKYLAHLVIDEGESALSTTEIELLYDRATNLSYLLEGLAPQVLEASPTMQARIEAGAVERRQNDYNFIMELLRDEYMTASQSRYLLMAREFYMNGAPDDFPYTDEMRTLVETDAWSWLMADGIETQKDVSDLFEARRKLKESQAMDVDQSIDPIAATTEGATKAALTASRVISITEGIDTLSKIDSETKGKELISQGMENLALSITQKVFAPISIGNDLLKAFHYHKTRRDGYQAAMERSGVKDDGSTDVKPDTADDVEKIRLGKVAHYAYKKTRRAFWSTITQMTLKIVKWIAHIITVLSGGTTAVVTGAIALSADITRAVMGISRNLKGLYKMLAGKRGVMRKKNAMELMELAKGGNEDAIQTIWDVNPFDEVSAVTKKAWNESKGLGIFGGSITELPKPESLDAFKESFKSGYYAERKARNSLTMALKNTMASQ